jgi:LPXTG-motif cell wall-anchored protein
MRHLFRFAIGVPLVAVGLVLTLVAVCLIAKTGDKSPYMYIVWGLGLLAILLGVKCLPKKQRRESPSAERYAGDTKRDSPATEKQKAFARELGIAFPSNITRGDLSDLISEERANDR